MPRKSYPPKASEAAHRWFVKAIDTLAEAEVLAASGKTRLGAHSRLYYAAHHVAVALLRLVGNPAKTHPAILGWFGKEWVKNRGFPASYGRLLNRLFDDRGKADYGEYVPSMEKDVAARIRHVHKFFGRASKEIPPVSMAKILGLLADENPEVRDYSFDVYCPKSYFHHTRFMVWSPRGRVTDRWLVHLINGSDRMLKGLGVKESKDYVVGLNSKVNQYAEKHFVMLDFDDTGSFPAHALKGEPGFVFRTSSGFHFIGSRLYDRKQWQKQMRKYSRIASTQHYDLSMKRGYSTLRITASPRKPQRPVYMGRTE